MAKSTVKKPASKVAKPIIKPEKKVNDEKIQQAPKRIEIEIDVTERSKAIIAEAEKFITKNTPPAPADFLTSKGFSQYHEGQNINATFEQVHELLKEYRAL